MVKKRGRTVFKESWGILKRNKVLFVPNVLMLLVNLVLFGLLMGVSGLGRALLDNNYFLLKESFSVKLLVYFLIYVGFGFLTDNFFLASKYGMIKEVILKKKTSLSSGFKFGKKFYWTTLGIHVLSYLIIFVPLFLLGFFLFFLLPEGGLVALTIAVPLMIVWLVYITIRLLFVYPVMAFEKKGAYNSLQEDFHYVKTHLHHSFVTWIIVIGVFIVGEIIRENVNWMTDLLQNQIIFLGVIGAGLIIFIELVVSVWEHVFIFKSYLAKK